MLLAQRDAWRELRGGGQPVATIHNLSPFFALADNVQTDDMLAKLEAMYWTVWMRADRDGVLELPGRLAREIPDLKEACDLVGFSYYSATGVDEEGRIAPYPRDARIGPMGYAPWSEGLGIVLERLADELPGRPILVCEHGVGTGETTAQRPEGSEAESRPMSGNDEWRCDILRESLQIVSDTSADVRGFFHWTGVDNYEWPYGFDVQFGCFTRDREPKGSAELLRSYATAR
jgi:beta-glucosidase